MELTILVDNNTFIDRYFLGEPGLSFYIEEGNRRILFDAGYSNLFLINARKLNINLLNLDFLVISHGHIDHTGGLEPLIKFYSEAELDKINLKKPVLVAHPHAFISRYTKTLSEIGSLISEEKLSRFFKLNLSKNPVWLTNRLVFLGEIERKNNFEALVPIGKIITSNSNKDDYLLDDSALVYKSDKGLIIITGCSHAGICNIIEYAKKVCKEDRIFDIIGGFHLQNPSKNQMQKTIEYLEKDKIKKMHACHCTDLNSKVALSKITELVEAGVGLKLKYN